jgi:hypothetical protein
VLVVGASREVTSRRGLLASEIIELALVASDVEEGLGRCRMVGVGLPVAHLNRPPSQLQCLRSSMRTICRFESVLSTFCKSSISQDNRKRRQLMPPPQMFSLDARNAFYPETVILATSRQIKGEGVGDIIRTELLRKA